MAEMCIDRCQVGESDPLEASIDAMELPHPQDPGVALVSAFWTKVWAFKARISIGGSI